MSTKKIDMKRFLTLIGALVCMLSMSESAWATYSHNAALKVIASPNNQGVVYAAPSEDVTDENDEVIDHIPSAADYSAAAAEHTSESVDAGSNQPAYLTAYAIPNQGYKFNGWSSPGGNGSPALYHCTTSDNPIQVKVLGSSANDGTNTATITANFIQNPTPAWMVQYLTATNGSYTATYNSPGATQPTIGGAAVTTYDNDPITLTATPASGYVFYRFYGIDGDSNKYTIGDITVASQTVSLPEGTIKVGAEFTNHALIAEGSTYPNLKDALQALRKNDGTYEGMITLLQDYTVPAGYYTIPAGVTILVPYKAGQTPKTTIERTFNVNYVKPSQYRKLTLASGVHMDVFGTIEAGCKQSAKGQSDAANGAPTGPYGHIYMESGSDMTIESGAILRAWGFVTGDGTIDVRRGGEVHEQFQILDFKGGSNTSNMCGGLSAMQAGTSHNEGDVFPLNQYFIQNVEVKATYHPGAKLFCSTAWYMSMSLAADDIQLVGVRNHKDGSADDVAMFLMDDEDESDDTWIRKYYDRATDRQMYEVNNSAAIGSFVITMDGRIFPTANFDLPITSNMTIHLLYGNMDMTQDAVLLAGAEIILDKQSTFVVPEGIKLYLYDQAEWDKFVFSGFYAQRVKYVPHLNGAPTSRAEGGSTSVKPASAAIRVGGTMQIDGAIYTTEGGANITSTNEEAGTILFNKNGAPAASSQVCQWKGSYVYSTTPSAILRNEDTDHPTTTTAGTPAGQSYCYMNGKWTMMTVDPDSTCFVYDNYGTYYAKPDEYVAINATKDPTTKVISGNDDHTFSDANGEGKLYILVDECQWWEVVNEDNLYHCQHPQNDTYYWWNDARMVGGQLKPGWEEKRYTITWKDWDGSVITTYQLTYGVTPKYNSNNPTRPADVDYTYNFTGWSPAFAPVTGDQIYTATYSKEQIKYTIIFKFVDSYHNGAEIDRQLLARDEMPTIPTVNRAGWYLKWTPAVSAVTGNATYEADWMEELPDNYTITWKNYDGSTITTTEPARDASAETVLAGAPTATKPNTTEYRYEFAGWQPAVTAATADASYVAQFNEIAQTYAIRFYQENGTTQIGETQHLSLGADPVVPSLAEYNKENTTQYTFTRVWKIKGTSTIVGVGVPSVTGAADYVAVFEHTINRYTIAANSEVEGETGNVAGCTFTGAGTYNCGVEVTLTAIPNTGYEFVKWKDTESTDASRTFYVEANRTYTAIVRPASLELGDNETKVITRATRISALGVHATSNTSSNLIGAQNLTLTSSNSPVYFDLTRGTGQVFKHHTWYAFSVPFEVDPAAILFDGVTMQYHEVSKKDDYEILYYDGSERAANGKTANCWIKAEKAGEHLYPGKFYMIANTRRDVTTIRFPKVEGADLLTTSVAISSHESGTPGDANWNGIANPSLFHANMDAIGSAEHVAHIYNPDYNDPNDPNYGTTYVKKFLNSYTTILGVPFFVQVPETNSVVVEPLPTGPASAPRRAKTNAADTTVRYQVMIAREGKKATDDVIIRMDEQKEEDVYVLGRDLVRMGMSTINPQMWVDRYNEKLCVNVQAPLNNVADYPLGIFAPANAEYTIYIANQSNDDNKLYLTLDGVAVWNLSEGAYTLYLDGGTTNRYGLRIVAPQAPEVATGMDEAVVDAHGETQKVLIDNIVYIIRNGEVYTITGQKAQ